MYLYTSQDVLKYEMRGSTRALDYYYLNPQTGIITLKRLLTDATHTSDDVSTQRIVTFLYQGWGTSPADRLQFSNACLGNTYRYVFIVIDVCANKMCIYSSENAI